MPTSVAHWLFAKSVEKKVQELDKSIRLSKSAFYYGTQGPDFLFAHRAWRMAWGGKNLMNTGSELHHACPSKMFALMKEYLENEQCDKDTVKSYIYGFLCHYVLDSNAHPYIYATQAEYTREFALEDCRSIIVHNLIEQNIDSVLCCDRLGYVNANDFEVYKTFEKSAHLIDEMASLMAYVTPKLVDCDAKKEDFADGLRDMRFTQHIMCDKTGLRRRAVGIIEKPLKKPLEGPLLSSLIRQKVCDKKWDYLNENHSEWTVIFDKTVKSTKSFYDLFDDAKIQIEKLVEAFNSADAENAIREVCGDISFDTGVRWDISEPIN